MTYYELACGCRLRCKCQPADADRRCEECLSLINVRRTKGGVMRCDICEAHRLMLAREARAAA